MNKWNGKRFSIYDKEEKQVLGLLDNLGEQTNYNTDEVENLKNYSNDLNNKKVSHEDLERIYKLNNSANFTGSWHGVERPTKANEGMSTILENLIDVEIPLINKQIEKVENNNFNKILDRKIDNIFLWFGYNCINIIGDSITHGANAPDIYKNSWAELLRKSLQSKYNTFNQGFEKAWGTIGNTIQSNMKTFHETIYGTNWNKNGEETNNISLSSCYTTSTQGELHFIPRKSSKFRIIYESVQDGGTFNYWLKSNPNVKLTCNTFVSSGISRPFYTDILECKLGDEIVIKNTTEGKTIKILGVQYFENEKDLMINNYGRSGSKLFEISDDVLYDYAKAGIIFFSFGHNDSFFPQNDTLFTQKINTFINAVKETGAFVVVNDFCWNRSENYHTRKELKRLAKEVDGLYIGYTEMLYGEGDINNWITSGFLSDASHPSLKGHRNIHNIICDKLNLPQDSYFYNTIDKVSTENINSLTNKNLLVKNKNIVTGKLTISGDVSTVTSGLSGGVILKVGVPPKENTDFYGFINCKIDNVGGSYPCGFTLLKTGELQIWYTPNGTITNIQSIFCNIQYETE